MRMFRKLLSFAALVAAIPGLVAAQQTDAQTPAAGQTTAVDQVVDRIVAREQQEVKTLRQFNPIIETYIQDMRGDQQLGAVPVKDYYFLGTAYLSKGVVEHSLLEKKQSWTHKMNPGKLGGVFSASYDPEGFLQMIYLDTSGFDRQHYHFDYLRREFLGEVRCLVFDVTPIKNTGKNQFKGRIWVEDQDYAIVRFNGVYVPERHVFGLAVHFDSWRTNAGPNLWLPTYIYSQETDLKDFAFGHIHFKSQTRLWGYDLKHVGHQEEFSQLTVESANQVKDQSDQGATDHSPIEAERAWKRQAEQNVMDRLETAGLISPPGEVDKVMETVVNNIEVTNNLDVQPEIHCRVMLTSTLESFSIGHTIVLSRGLLDVLPDEATLAAMLAHEMGHVLLGRAIDSQWAFNDLTMFPVEQSLEHFNFHSTQADDDAANKRAVELLKKSPYKDKLNAAGLFLKELDAESKKLPALVSPHLGNHVYMAQELMTSSPQLEPAKLDQIAALPLGSRLKLNPWNDKVELVKAKAMTLLSEREKMPFEVTPFFPYLTREGKPGSTLMPNGGAKADVAKQQQPDPDKPQPPQQQPQQPKPEQPQPQP